MVQTGLLEFVVRIGSDWAGDFGNTPVCDGISSRCTELNTVQPKSEADCNQSQFL